VKNNIIKIAIFALSGALALTSCEQGLEESHDGITGTRIIVTAQTGDDSATRTALNGFTTEWVAGDKVGVFSPQAEATNVQLTATSSSATSAFGGDLFWGTGSHDFYVYYPYTTGTFARTAVPVSLPANQTQSAGGNSGHLATLDFMVAAPLSGVSAGGAVQFQFSHLFSILEFKVLGTGSLSAIELVAPAGTRLAFSGGTIDLAQAKPAGVYTISGSTASRSVTLNVTAPVTLTEDKSTTPVLYMMVSPADLSGGEITVTATIDGEEKTITANGFNIARGRKYTLVVDPDKGVEPTEDVLALIPDSAFLAYCESQMTEWDINRDGKLSFAEAAAVTQINVYGNRIVSLAGIEYFTGLTYLNCQSNQLTLLDVSKNTALTYLHCAGNQLTSLDVSKNTVLTTLYCNGNFTSLDLSKNTALTELSCGGSNKLASLDLSKNTALEYLVCSATQLTELDLSNNTALTILNCSSSQLTSLNVSECGAITYLDCRFNQLTSLDVSACTDLTTLTCFENQLTSLDISKNTALTSLWCDNNPGDGVSTFPVKAWFDNNSIPKSNLQTAAWDWNGKTITPYYYTDALPLVLSVDKASISANSTDTATFTVKQLGVDVTSKVRICISGGTCLVGNAFTTTTAGDYEFYAYYANNPDNKSNTVTVTAISDTPSVDFDATKALHKNVTFFTFTATWCEPCNIFKGYMSNMESDYGDNIVEINFYHSESETSVASNLEAISVSQLDAEGRFDVKGYPTLFAELDVEVGTPGYIPTQTETQNSYTKYVAYPAKTGIRVDSKIVGNKINATVTVGAKEADTYQIGALLIEDNIVAYQNGSGNNYNHTNVLRAKGMDNIFGEALGTMSVGETLSKIYNFDIASNYDRSNLYIVIYTLYKNSNGKWMIANSVKAPVEGTTDFKYDDGSGNQLYESTDYSGDKKVTVLQQATVGNGIDIVLMGDAYSDRQIAAGTYQTDMGTIYNNLFTEEPYKSFKNYFNVYYVTAVSANEGYGTGKSTVFSSYFGDGTRVGGDDQTCFLYAQRAISAARMDNALIVVSMNSNSYAGTCWMYGPSSSNDYGSGISVAYFPRGGDATTFARLLHHEANGHGFAKLADEYSNGGTITNSEKTETQRQQTNWGWWKNVDFTSDLSTIRWNYFLSDPRYADQGLGAYEGGLTYATGVWRPTENSIMRYNYGGFNAPSREAIYYRINKLGHGSDWSYNYADFATWDLAHRSSTHAAQAAGRGVLKPYEHTPPVVIPHSWKEAANEQNNLVRQAHVR
jgi:thiol-disulfide isomerase/thioredoxin